MFTTTWQWTLFHYPYFPAVVRINAEHELLCCKNKLGSDMAELHREWSLNHIMSLTDETSHRCRKFNGDLHGGNWQEKMDNNAGVFSMTSIKPKSTVQEWMLPTAGVKTNISRKLRCMFVELRCFVTWPCERVVESRREHQTCLMSDCVVLK